jgi:3-hydroxyisobutyrate dehydrogenase-like beta-hydroxyacid dehydrogenase
MNTRAVGMIGLGLLGGALAERFLRAGLAVTGFDIAEDRRRALADLGGEPADSAASVIAGHNTVVLSLPTSDVVEAVLTEVSHQLRPGQFIVDTTTGDPERTAALGARLAGLGVRYLDATVSGSSEQARAGSVLVMAGGERSAFDACAELFAAFARQWFHVGPWGAGARMKLVSNLVLGLERAALAEGLAFAAACGLDPGETLKVLQAGAAYARVMDAKGPRMIARDFRPQARLAQHLKDVRLILAEGQRVGAHLPLSELHARLLEKVASAGFGDEDNAAVLRAFISAAARPAAPPA